MQTNPIKTLIIDDEADSRELLAHLLRPYADRIHIIGQAAGAEQAEIILKQQQPQLLFLDVQMPGKNGFQFLDQLEQLNFEVIFVTSYQQYAISAIKFNALDYLLKPIDPQELKTAVDKAHARILSQHSPAQQWSELLRNLQRPQKIAIHVNDTVQLLDLDEIVHIEGLGNYSRIYAQNGQVYLIPRLLKDFEDYLGQNSPFIRLNRSILANIRHISSYSKGEPCIVQLSNGKHIDISRRRKHEVIAQIAIKLG